MRNARRIALILGDEKGVRRGFDALAPGVIALLIEVAQQRMGICRRVVKRGKRSGFVVIDVVAGGPEEGFGWWRHYPIPLWRRLLGGNGPGHCLGAAVAKGLIAAADGVVVHGDGVEIKVGKCFAEVPRGYPRHP